MNRYGPARLPKSMRPAHYGAFVLFTEHQAAMNAAHLEAREYNAQAEVMAAAIEQILSAPLGAANQAIEHAKEVALSYREMEASASAEVSS